MIQTIKRVQHKLKIVLQSDFNELLCNTIF